jgi:hypothetical protein
LLKNWNRLLLGIVVGEPFGLGAVHDHLAAHEGLVVENLDGALGFVDGAHFDEPIALRLVGVSIVDNLYAANCPNSLEELFELVLGGIVREVSKVEASRFDRGWGAGFPFCRGGTLGDANSRFGSLARFLRSRFTRVFSPLARGAGGFLIEAEGLPEFLPPR